jgi:hypothetical protein
MSAFQIFPATYGFHVSSSHATPSQETDHAGVSEAAGFQPLRSVTEETIAAVKVEFKQILFYTISHGDANFC